MHDEIWQRELEVIGRRLGADCPVDAEDLAAEAAARALAHPAPDGRIGPWMARIAANLRIDAWRQAARARRACEVYRAMITRDADPGAAARAIEHTHEVRAAIDRLPADQRKAIELRYFADLDPDQIARMTGVAPATARTRIHRALVRLREQLAHLRSFVPIGRVFAPGGWAAMAPAGMGAIAFVLLAAPSNVGPILVTAPAAAPHEPAATRTPARVVPPPSISAPSTIAAPKRTQPPRRTEPSAPVPPPPAQRFAFEDDVVNGAADAPEHAFVQGGPQAVSHRSLIEIPSSFVGPLSRSIDDL